MKSFLKYTLCVLLVAVSIALSAYAIAEVIECINNENSREMNISTAVEVEEQDEKGGAVISVTTSEERVEEKEPVRLSEDDVFVKFSKEYWEENVRSAGEIEEMTAELAGIICEYLELDREIEIVIINDSQKRYSGCYSSRKSSIEINLYQIFRAKKPHSFFVNVVGHELRHAWQYERYRDRLGTALEASYGDYITPDEDYQGYYNQLAEVDARLYGEYIEDLVSAWIKDIEEDA